MLLLSIQIGEQEPTTHQLEEVTTSLGSVSDDSIVIPELGTQRFEIMQREDGYVIKNLSPEEATSAELDGGAFEEAILKDGGVLVAGDVRITANVPDVRTSAKGVPIEDAEEEFDLDEELSKINALFGDEEETPAETESVDLSDLDIDALFQEVSQQHGNDGTSTVENDEEDDDLELEFAADEEDQELLQLLGSMEEEVVRVPPPSDPNTTPEKKDSAPAYEEITIESYDTGGVEDYETLDNDEPFDQDSFASRQSRRPLQVAVALLAAIGIFAIGSYLSTTKDNTRQELIAERGIADLSVALLHARMANDPTPSDQWLEPDYLERWLPDLLSSKQRARSSLTQGGSIATNAYKLTLKADSSGRFLLAAQPVGGMWQWLVPKAALYVDSAEMLIRRTKASSKLASTLENTQQTIADALATTELRQESEVVAFSTLSQPGDGEAFAIHPGIEGDKNAISRIYNAPRYYRFSKPLIEQLLALDRNDEGSAEHAAASELIARYANLPNLALYSPRGPEIALAVEKILYKSGYPRQHIACLRFRPSDGAIIDCRLPATEAAPVVPDLPRPTLVESTLTQQKQSARLAKTDEVETVDGEESRGQFDHTDPIFRSLADFAASQQEERSKWDDAVYRGVLGGAVSGAEYERERMHDRQQREREQHIADALERHKHEHGDGLRSLQQFSDYLSAAGLDQAVPDSITKELNLNNIGTVEEHIHSLFASLSAAEDLTTVEQVVTDLLELLQRNDLHDEEAVAAHKNNLRRSILDKVGELLLSPAATRPTEVFTGKNRRVLTNILNLAEVGELQEKEFYLREFDLLVERYRKLTDSTESNVAASQIKQQLKAIPISTVCTQSTDDPRNLGRLGQQLLVEASSEAVGDRRDHKLYRAVGLLAQATNENRSYWTDLLEARRLLTETPKQRVMQGLNGPLGFATEEQFPLRRMQELVKQYIFALQKLNEESSTGGSEVRWRHFRNQQGKALRTILDQAELLQAQGDAVLEGLNQYIVRLEEYYNDYLRAREQGLLIGDGFHHSQTILQLERQLTVVKNLLPRFSDVAHNLRRSCGSYSTMAQSQIARLNAGHTPSLDESIALEQQNSNLPTADLAAGTVSRELLSILEPTISPYPSRG